MTDPERMMSEEIEEIMATMMERRQRIRHRPYLVGLAYFLSAFMMFRAFSSSSFCFSSELGDEQSQSTFTTSAARSAPPRPILFMHIHKSGGTGVCEAMRLHQKQVNITNMLAKQDKQKIATQNCNTELTHPHLHDAAFHAVQTCRMLELYSTDATGTRFRRNNFLAVEIPLADPMPCRGFRSFALMREPISRCLSHFQFHRYSEKTVSQWMNRKLNGNTHRDYFLNGYHSVNNMVIRQLLGRTRYIDVRPIDEEDFERAKARVDLFSAFVPLKYLRHENVLRLLNRTIPEYYEALRNSEDVHINKNDNATLHYSPTFLERLAKENEYDTKLYQYVLQKLGIDDIG